MEKLIRSIVQLAAPDVGVDWVSREQGAPYPGVVLTVVSSPSGHTHSGPDGLSFTRIQIDVYALKYGEAKILSRTIRSALDGFSSDIIQGVFYKNERDMREAGSKEPKHPFRISQDYKIAWRIQ